MSKKNNSGYDKYGMPIKKKSFFGFYSRNDKENYHNGHNQKYNMKNNSIPGKYSKNDDEFNNKLNKNSSKFWIYFFIILVVLFVIFAFIIPMWNLFQMVRSVQ